jgi:hypothetical protein
LVWISNFRLLSAFIVPVTLSRDDNYSGGHGDNYSGGHGDNRRDHM